jgi:Domain of unknown function (DUF4331)
MSPLSRVRRGFRALAALGVTALILTLGVAPMLTSGADHLDAPSLGSISVNPNDTLNVSKVRGPLDINDVYAFRGSNANRTVLAVTVNPAINVLGPTTFQPGAVYRIHIDTGTNARTNTRYNITFGDPDASGVQHYTVKQDGKAVASGFTDGAKGKERNRSDVMAFAGMRSDPFFFDLLGFLGSVKGQGTRTLNDGNESDFFVGLNTLAIVLEVPNSAIGGNGTNIGVWASTRVDGVIADQMGRPAINTVFNKTDADKDAFNAGLPVDDQANFRANVVATLLALGNDQATADSLADFLLPDILTVDLSKPTAFPNGRALSDDVIDTELGLITGGAVPTDCVDNDNTFRRQFPYLATDN